MGQITITERPISSLGPALVQEGNFFALPSIFSRILLSKRGALNISTVKIITFLLLALFLAQPSLATTALNGDKLTVSKDTRIDDDLLITAGVCEVNGYVDGDILALARDFRLRGTITGVGVIASEYATIEGDISHSLAVFSRRAFVSGTVRGSSYMFVQKIEIDEEALFSRDVTLFCDTLFMGGTVSGKLRCRVGSETTISGSVSEDLEINSDKSVRVLETANIGGDLIIHGTATLEVEEGAVITGEVVRLENQVSDSDGFSFSDLFRIFFVFGTLFTFGAMTLGVSRSHFERSSTAITQDTLRSFAFGIIALTAGAIITMVLIITFVGLLTAAILFALITLFMVLLGPLYVAGGLGMLILSSKRGHGFGVTLARVFVGLIILLAIASIPYAGLILYFLAGIIGFGAFIIGATPKSSSPGKSQQSVVPPTRDATSP